MLKYSSQTSKCQAVFMRSESCTFDFYNNESFYKNKKYIKKETRKQKQPMRGCKYAKISNLLIKKNTKKYKKMRFDLILIFSLLIFSCFDFYQQQCTNSLWFELILTNKNTKYQVYYIFLTFLTFCFHLCNLESWRHLSLVLLLLLLILVLRDK